MKENFVTTIFYWKESAQSFKSVQKIAFASMMTALNTLIGAFKIVLIPKVLTISFASLAVAPCAIVCGPLLTGTVGMIADILKYLIYPDGPFFFGFTLNEFLTGFIYGCFFYKVSNISLKRVICARVVIVLLLNMILTPLWLFMMYGDSFLVLVSARIVKNIVMLPIDIGLLYMVIKTAQKIVKHSGARSLK